MSTSIGNRRAAVLVALAVIAIVVLLSAPMLGAKALSIDAVMGSGDVGADTSIFWRIRLPRVCIAFLAGAALALSGMTFQAIFRNPLATPFTLGVASGASLGSAIYLHLGMAFTIAGVSGISIAAFIGASLSIALVYGLARMKHGFSTATMLLAGVAISFFFSSLILFTQYLTDFTNSFRIIRWLMGGLEVVGFESVLDLLPFVISGTAIIYSLTHELNLLMSGEDIAISRGVDATRTRRLLFIATSLMVGSVVAICGPIGFVGMMAPHICRLLIGADHRWLTPATLLFGGVFLTLCDLLARTLIAPAEIPVGIITALLGGPFFIWLLMRRGSAGSEIL